MSGEEREGQRREVFGLDIAHCDICGIAAPAAELHVVESPSPLADYDHVNLICSTCQERLLRGEIDLESYLIDEDERRDLGPEQW